MKKLIFHMLTFFSLSCTLAQGSVHNALLGEMPPAVAQLMYDYVHQFPAGTQVAVGWIQGDSVAFYGAITQKDTVHTINNADAVFEIGSITKTMTSAVLAQLVVDGTINLNDSINAYYDFPFKEKQDLSFVSLANHTSGLAMLPSNFGEGVTDPTNPYQGYNGTLLEAYLRDHLSVDEQRKGRVNYSNLGVGILGYTLARVAQRDFSDLLAERIFIPLGMTASGIGLDRIDTVRLVTGQDMMGKPTNNWDLNTLAAAGGALSSPRDMVHYLHWQLSNNDAAVQLTHQATTSDEQNVIVGLGWFINKNEGLFMHSGGTNGYTSSAMFSIENQQAVIVLTNLSAFHSKRALVDELASALMRL